MPCSEIEPLEPEMWFARAADLRARFDPAVGESELEAALRRAYHLVQLTPVPLRAYVRPSIDEDAFEQLLACGAFDMAALALAGEPAGLRLGRSEGSASFRAVVWLRGQSKMPEAEGSSPASSILGAWLNCLTALWPACSIGHSRNCPPGSRH